MSDVSAIAESEQWRDSGRTSKTAGHLQVEDSSRGRDRRRPEVRRQVGIDESLRRLTGSAEGEQVSLWNINNGQRIETYAIPFPAGTGPDLALSEMRLTPLRLRPSANPCSSDTSDARV